ncbi:hypothetical protein OF83DRAFT_899062 [Amylostereum chailletii]|nr:hypothetical protein OF83DRAFT_899062 [Amylostereum chailletii]
MRDVQARDEHTKICKEWESKKAAGRSDELQVIKTARKQRIISLFSQAGFVENDLEVIWHMRDVSVAKPLTDKAWERLYPTLEPAVKKWQRMRILGEIQRRRSERINAVEETYWMVLKASVPPNMVPFMPTDVQCRDWPAIQAIIDPDAPEITNDWR